MASEFDNLIGERVKATRKDEMLEGTLVDPVKAGPHKGQWRIEGPGGTLAHIDPSEWTITAVPESGSSSWDKPPRS